MSKFILSLILLVSINFYFSPTLFAQESGAEAAEHDHEGEEGHDHKEKHAHKPKHKHKHKHKHKAKHKHAEEGGHNHDHDEHGKESQAGQSLKRAFEKQQAQIKKAPKVEEPVDTTPAINVDETNFKSIFASSLETQSSEMKEKTNGFEMEVQARYLTIDEIEISNPAFTVNYDEGVKSMPMVQIGGGKEFLRKNNFSLATGFSAGYGFKEARLSATTRTGTRVVDIVGLHVVPLSLGLEARQRLNFLAGTSLFATPQVGTYWLRQSGSLDGMEQNRWATFYGLRAGLLLFTQSPSASANNDHWFDGMSLSGSVHRTSGSGDTLDTSSFDLGIRLLL